MRIITSPISSRKKVGYMYYVNIIVRFFKLQKDMEACNTEKELFENLLGAKIETIHRLAGGDKVCEFHIKDKIEDHL
jgi:hypothetical protein